MLNDKVVYTKVEVTDPVVVQLAKEVGQPVTAIAAMINQDRYRKAYNKLQQSRMKVIRALIKQHPELVKEVNDGTK